MRRLALAVLGAALITAAFAQTGVTYDNYNEAVIGFEATFEMPTAIDISTVGAYQVTIPATHLHPGNTFQIVIAMQNDSERAVKFWSEGLTAAIADNSLDDYISVTGGHISWATALEVAAGGTGDLVFEITISDALEVDDARLGQDITFGFAVNAKGVIDTDDSDITNEVP